jgi:hypothetical protein
MRALDVMTSEAVRISSCASSSRDSIAGLTPLGQARVAQV